MKYFSDKDFPNRYHVKPGKTLEEWKEETTPQRKYQDVDAPTSEYQQGSEGGPGTLPSTRVRTNEQPKLKREEDKGKTIYSHLTL